MVDTDPICYNGNSFIHMEPQMSVTAHIPNSWYAPAHEAWLKDKRTDAIQLTIAQLNQHAIDQKPTPLILQLSYYLFFINDYASACMILEQQLKRFPDNTELLSNLAVNYSRSKRYIDAIEYAQRVIKLLPDNVLSYDIMASCYFELNDKENASKSGTSALILKDKASPPIANKQWQLPNKTPQEIALQTGKTNVISFSLWGNNRRYLRGALRNVLLAPDIYPNWTVRLNVDDTVPSEFISLVKSLGAQVIMHPKTLSIKEKLCWRFEVANDSSVGYFLVRDADSVIGVREVNAVNEWLNSDKFFHVMRDWWTHTDLMLAGMWGGVAGVLPNLTELLKNYVSASVETPNIDQWFLRDRVWAYVRSSCMVHDRCFDMPNTIKLSQINDTDYHIGQNEIVVRPLEQANFLQAWLQQYPCLGS